ncbi:MAG: hypothetical protein WBM40_05970 [Thiohalocapsa sp.]
MTSTTLDEILEQLRASQRELDKEIDRLLREGRDRFSYSLERGKVVFERGMRNLHRQQRKGILRYLRETPIAFILSAPLIYGMVIPLIILDLSMTIYQHVCFRIYGIPRVPRGDYLIIDRHELAYLNAIEKLNCLYCGYGNQLIEYAREVAGRTEQFWCPIKHARRTQDPHHRTGRFVDYGDAAGYSARLKVLRKSWGVDSTEG